MASKKYKGKLCVYCATRLSEGRDHVFAGEFFMPGAKYQAIVVPEEDGPGPFLLYRTAG